MFGRLLDAKSNKSEKQILSEKSLTSTKTFEQLCLLHFSTICFVASFIESTDLFPFTLTKR